MIIDKLENASKYYNLGVNMKKGLQFLQNSDLISMPCEKQIIDGESVWANVQEFLTKDEDITLWEVHRRYTDIQFVISGCEKMQWANLDAFIPNSPFQVDDDICFGQVKSNTAIAQLVVPQGFFVIFTEQDVHKPALKVLKSEKVKKIVVKVAN